ncbi:MAG: hypothetical protein IJS09_07545 [Treponema sp.]|nr:hypothetical protein [Treponema sp.]
MEVPNYFTCIAYDTVDFLIQSKYIVFGLYLAVEKEMKCIEFNEENLPHVHIGSFLETAFSCNAKEGCNVVLVLKMQNFPDDVKKQIQTFTGTAFPLSGNFALSVNSLISSKNIDVSSLRLLPKSIRQIQNECGVSAIGFVPDKNNKSLFRRRILLSPDCLLRTYFSNMSSDTVRGK